jgi:hypothetical protein
MTFRGTSLCAGLLALATLVSPVHAQNASIYAAADSVALATPEAVTNQVATLGAHFRAALPGERDRARAIYRWMVENIAYDAALFFRGGGVLATNSQLPERVLRRRLGVCEGFSGLYTALAQAAGLEARSVVGDAKAYSTDPRRSFRIQQHAWNAVRVEGGEWLLLDASWGAGDIEGRQFVRRPRDFYFATPPEVLVWSHRGRSAADQLLEQPVSAAEFERMPFTHPGLWSLGFSPDQLRQAYQQPQWPGLVSAYGAPGLDITVVEAPLTANLPSGVPQRFSVRAGAATEVVVVSGTTWTRLERENDTFTGSASLTGPELVVMTRYPERPEGVVVLKYTQ